MLFDLFCLSYDTFTHRNTRNAISYNDTKKSRTFFELKMKATTVR